MFKMTMTTAALAVLVGATTLQAQGPITLELRGGAAVPTADMGDATLRIGGALEATAAIRVLPHLHAYGGWGYFQSRTDRPLGGQAYDVEATGYVFGMRFLHPVAGSVSGWLQGGGVYKHIELENSAGTIVADSDHELGWEAGAGVSVPVSRSIAITPGARYRTLTADLTVGSATQRVDLSYIAAEIGVTWSFGSLRRTAAARR
jgi:opacity protein-like surface antigen